MNFAIKIFIAGEGGRCVIICLGFDLKINEKKRHPNVQINTNDLLIIKQ